MMFCFPSLFRWSLKNWRCFWGWQMHWCVCLFGIGLFSILMCHKNWNTCNLKLPLGHFSSKNRMDCSKSLTVVRGLEGYNLFRYALLTCSWYLNSPWKSLSLSVYLHESTNVFVTDFILVCVHRCEYIHSGCNWSRNILIQTNASVANIVCALMIINLRRRYKTFLKWISLLLLYCIQKHRKEWQISLYLTWNLCLTQNTGCLEDSIAFLITYLCIYVVHCQTYKCSLK